MINIKSIKTLGMFLIFVFSHALQADESAQVQKAIEFLKTACVTSGSSLELKAAGNGSLKIRSILGSGIEGSVSLTKKELEGFADAASELSAQQASEMRNCMKPYIDKILSSLLTSNASIEPRKIEINTSGHYFVTAEFDQVMLAVSVDPDGFWSVSSISNKTKLHPVKVKSYFLVAQKNKLGYITSSNNFHLYDKGVNYILAKRLVR